MNQLTIGKVAELSGVHLETIRFYERRGLVPQPPRTESGYRAFPPTAVNRIQFIKRGQDLGFSLREIKELLFLTNSPGATKAEIKQHTLEKLADIREKMRLLRAMERDLKALVEACSGRGDLADCPIVKDLSSHTVRSRSPAERRAKARMPERRKA